MNTTTNLSNKIEALVELVVVPVLAVAGVASIIGYAVYMCSRMV